jgi:hypothetical protein
VGPNPRSGKIGTKEFFQQVEEMHLVLFCGLPEVWVAGV